MAASNKRREKKQIILIKRDEGINWLLLSRLVTAITTAVHYDSQRTRVRRRRRAAAHLASVSITTAYRKVVSSSLFQFSTNDKGGIKVKFYLSKILPTTSVAIHSLSIKHNSLVLNNNKINLFSLSRKRQHLLCYVEPRIDCISRVDHAFGLL